MFISASARYPSSILAQSLHIALACKEQRQDPQRLGKRLLESSEAQAKIITLGDNAHRDITRENGPAPLTEDTVKEMVVVDFNYATRYQQFPSAEIEKILEDSEHVDALQIRDRVNTLSIQWPNRNRLGRVKKQQLKK